MKNSLVKVTAGLGACILLILLNLSCSSIGVNPHYQNAVREARLGNADFAFMELRSYLQESPESDRAQNARFAMAEYYFQNKDYRQAILELTDYVMRYPEGKNTVFAQALLYKIFLEYQSEPELLGKLKELFFSKSIVLIFSEAKTKRYKSILGNRYSIMEYVDKIDVFQNDTLLFEIKF